MDIVPILLQLVLVAFLIFMNGFFVAAEFACVKIRPSRLRQARLPAEGRRVRPSEAGRCSLARR